MTDLEWPLNTPAYLASAQRADELLKLLPGWDGYGSMPPKKESVDLALGFIRDGIGVLAGMCLEVPVPFLHPTNEGGVLIEWELAGREVDIELLGDDIAWFATTDTRSSDGVGREDALRALAWLPGSGDQMPG